MEGMEQGVRETGAADLCDDSRGAGDDACHDVRMAIEVFRGAVDDDVESDGGRPEVDGGREGAVDDGGQLVLPAEGNHRFEIAHLHQP